MSIELQGVEPEGAEPEGVVELMLPGERLEPSRRAFLELAGFGISAVALGGCSRGPVTKLVPDLVAPEEYVAGRSYWVATSCSGCAASCGVLAKCRDGRPIKLEGNRLDPLTGGGLCATGQADVLSLYDSKRISEPRVAGGVVGWRQADEAVRNLLGSVQAGRVRLLTGTENGPSTRAAIARFKEVFEGAQHVSYDALSVAALREAHGKLFGRPALPSYHFEAAHVIASFGADFLGTWIAPVGFARDYAQGRRPDDGHMSLHVQLEAAMTVTGTVADRRIGLTPSQTPAALAALCALLESKAGRGGPEPTGIPEHLQANLLELADVLWAARGRSLVISGLNDLQAQLHAAHANQILGNYGRTLSVGRPSLQGLGDDRSLWNLKRELEGGKVDCLIISGVNPAYDLPADFLEALSKAGTVVHHTAQEDETVDQAQIVLPRAHALESWGDGEPQMGRFVLQQPLIPSFRKSRTLRELLAAWVGDVRGDAELLRDHWRNKIHRSIAPGESFERFFDRALQVGFVEVAEFDAVEPEFDASALPKSTPVQGPGQDEGQGLELILYPKLGLLDGRHAHNPWLQELPNPVTKATWDNYACLSPERAEAMGLETGDLVEIEIAEESLRLPVLVQRGQHDDVVAVALGYGRKGTDRFSNIGPEWLEGALTVQPGETVGRNAARLLSLDSRGLHYTRGGVSLTRVRGHVKLARTQDHHTLEVPAHLAPKGAEVRDAVLTASLADYVANPEHALHGGHHLPETDLWPEDHEPPLHHWGMVVDLASCTGCSACVVSCQAENNVPVVGKDEVLRHREMHWMRIDRYFEGEGGEATASHQPMFCQQCDNAPCESVCPVLATVHSTEGLNQQVYNRCVGTRYCANTCPYKVRRFNWFNYPHEDKLENHSLNPDVTVRTRGVMEKCSFCSQRIQEAKSEAIAKGIPIADGDIQVACQQSCPTRAIVFGDLMDPESAVSKLIQRQRSYRVLEELNVKPSVTYLARIRNKAEGEAHHG